MRRIGRKEVALRKECMVLLGQLDDELARIVQRQWHRVDHERAKELFARLVAEVRVFK